MNYLKILNNIIRELKREGIATGGKLSTDLD